MHHSIKCLDFLLLNSLPTFFFKENVCFHIKLEDVSRRTSCLDFLLSSSFQAPAQPTTNRPSTVHELTPPRKSRPIAGCGTPNCQAIFPPKLFQVSKSRLRLRSSGTLPCPSCNNEFILGKLSRPPPFFFLHKFSREKFHTYCRIPPEF